MACTSGWSCHSIHSPATQYTAATTTSSTGRVRPLTCIVCSGSGQVNVVPPTVVWAAGLEGAGWLGVVDLVYPIGVAAAWTGGCSAGMVATGGMDAGAPDVVGPPQDRQNRSPSSVCEPQLPQNAMAALLVADAADRCRWSGPVAEILVGPRRSCPCLSREHLPREDFPGPAGRSRPVPSAQV